MKPFQHQKTLPRNGHIDLNKAAGTGISFASGGAMIGAEVAGIIGSICFAILLAIIGVGIIYLIRNSK